MWEGRQALTGPQIGRRTWPGSSQLPMATSFHQHRPFMESGKKDEETRALVGQGRRGRENHRPQESTMKRARKSPGLEP